MRELIDVTLLNSSKKYLLEPCCDQCHANVSIEKINSFSGEVLVAHCLKCGNYLKVIEQAELVNNKIEFPEYNDNLLEEFDKQFFENGQDDDLTETALEQINDNSEKANSQQKD